MKILVITGSFPGFNHSWLIDQLAGLKRRGHELTIIASPVPRGEPEHPGYRAQGFDRVVHYRPRRMDNKALRLAHTGLLALRHVPMNPRLARTLDPRRVLSAKILTADVLTTAVLVSRLGRFDVVHCHDGEIGYSASVLRRLGYIRDPIITTFHGPDVSDETFRAKHGHGRLVSEVCNAVTVGSGFIRRRMLETMPIAPERIHTIPMGLEMGDMTFKERQPDADGTVRLLTVTRFVPVKGLLHAINAFGMIAAQHPGLIFELVGSGPLEAELRARVHELGLDDRVRFLGAMTRAELRPVWDRAHLFVQSGVVLSNGQAEGQGVTLLEAQASGIPVVCTDAGGMPESVEAGRSAIVVLQGDTEALAQGLDSMLRRASAWPEMGHRGRAFVERTLSNPVVLDRFEEVYRLAIKEGCRP